MRVKHIYIYYVYQTGKTMAIVPGKDRAASYQKNCRRENVMRNQTSLSAPNGAGNAVPIAEQGHNRSKMQLR